MNQNHLFFYFCILMLPTTLESMNLAGNKRNRQEQDQNEESFTPKPRVLLPPKKSGSAIKPIEKATAETLLSPTSYFQPRSRPTEIIYSRTWLLPTLGLAHIDRIHIPITALIKTHKMIVYSKKPRHKNIDEYFIENGEAKKQTVTHMGTVERRLFGFKCHNNDKDHMILPPLPKDEGMITNIPDFCDEPLRILRLQRPS